MEWPDLRKVDKEQVMTGLMAMLKNMVSQVYLPSAYFVDI